VLQYAYLNACFESCFANPIDEAIRSSRHNHVENCRKLDEVPYDFIRKRLSVLVAMDNHHVLITKGAVDNVLAVCSAVESAKGTVVTLDSLRVSIQDRFQALSSDGFRTLGVAYRMMNSVETIAKADETEMVFLGFLVLQDPPKADITQTVQQLQSLGVGLKMITGDNRLVAANVARQVGLSAELILTGGEIRQMSDEALRQQANASAVFAEVEPNQKERIILALKQAGHVVGYSVYLLWTTVAVVIATLILPYTPLAQPLGLRPVAPAFLLMLAAIVAAYIAAAEVAKRLFYHRTESVHHQ
jgi:P-type Mg2+ transporter